MKKVCIFHILGLNLKISYQIVSLFDMYIDMGERIAGKQDKPSDWRLPQGPLNSPKYNFVLHFGSCMKNWFSNCSPLLYICLHCDEGCICWHFGAPDTPGFYVWAQHDPEKQKKNIFFFYFKTQKVFIILLLYLTFKLIWKRG